MTTSHSVSQATHILSIGQSSFSQGEITESRLLEMMKKMQIDSEIRYVRKALLLFTPTQLLSQGQ